MPFELKEVLRARQGENFRLQAQYMNPQMGRVLKTIGFDHYYERGEGCYLYDADGPALPRLPVRVRGVRPGPRPSRGHPGPPRRPRRGSPQPRADGLRPAARAAGRGPREAVARRHRTGLLHQLGGRGHRVGHQVRPGRHQARPDRVLRPRLPRAHHRCLWRSTAGGSSGTGSVLCSPPRAWHSATSTPWSKSSGAATWPPSWSSPSRARA